MKFSEFSLYSIKNIYFEMLLKVFVSVLFRIMRVHCPPVVTVSKYIKTGLLLHTVATGGGVNTPKSKKGAIITDDDECDEAGK